MPRLPTRPSERTSRWWKPRKSSPSPPTCRCTIRVLAALGSSPRSASRSVKPRQGGLGLLPGGAHHHQVVGVADQHPVLAGRPRPVQPVQVDVRQQRGDHPALRGAGHRPTQRAVLHDSRAQHRPQQPQHALVTDAFLDRLHQLLVRNRLETVGDVRLDHPPATPPGLIDEHLQGVVRRAFRAEPETARQRSRLRRPARARSSSPPARSGHGPSGSTAVAVLAARLRDEHPPRRQRPPPPLPQIRGQLVEQPGHPVLLDIGQGGRVDARRAVVAAHLSPRPPQHVPAVDLVVQRVESTPGIGLGRPVQRMLQGTDRVTASPTRGGRDRRG